MGLAEISAKIHLLYALPRSGSTPVGRTIAYYLNACYGVTDLSEFFNPSMRGIRFENGRILSDHRDWVPESRPSRFSPAENQEKRRRLRSLEEARGCYYLKYFPPQLTSAEERRLLSLSATLFLRRRNSFEHLMSFLISYCTGLTYLYGGIHIPARSLTGEFRAFMDFLWRGSRFEKALQYEKTRRVAYYEDFLELGPQAFIESLGYRGKVDWGDLLLPDKQNPGDKLELFTNPDEIIHWYRQSPLNAAYPISESGKPVS